MSREYVAFKLNSNALTRALDNVEYKNLHNTFADAIQKSLEVIRAEAKTQLGSKVPNLAKYADTIVAEVAMTADEGRVKIIKDKQPNYKCKDEPYYLLHFFEKGTKVRKKKTDGYHYENNTNTKQGGARKHRNRGKSTGQIQPANFLSTAVASKEGEAYRTLEEALSKSIQEAWSK